jgi:hypothetical protein
VLDASQRAEMHKRVEQRFSLRRQAEMVSGLYETLLT